MAQQVMNAQVLLLTKTTSEWAVVTSTIPKGFACVETTTNGETKVKIGDGTKPFSELPYIALTETEITTMINAAQYDDSSLRILIQAAQDKADKNEQAITILNGTDETEGSVAHDIKVAKEEIDTKIGSLDDLKTTAKNNIVSAINELKQVAGTAGGAVTIETDTTTEGAAKSYTIKQDDVVVGTIDIPKDMVVSSGEVVVNPEGLEAGTYIVLTLANATEDKIYINVGTLVDIYKAKANAAQVQIGINTSTREISASIVAGSITSEELADDAITTDKIADNNITKDKLSTEVINTLEKAGTSIQTITTGETNGTIKVDGVEVPVAGLGSAAYTESTDYDVAGAADAALAAAKKYADDNKVDITDTLVLNCTL